MLIQMKCFKFYLSKCIPETVILELTYITGHQMSPRLSECLCHPGEVHAEGGRGAGPAFQSHRFLRQWEPCRPLGLPQSQPDLVVRSQQAYVRHCGRCAGPGSTRRLVPTTEHLPRLTGPACSSERSHSEGENRHLRSGALVTASLSPAQGNLPGVTRGHLTE